MADYRVISADSHFVEPPKMWVERLDRRFRDRAPHTVRGLNGKDGEFFVCENITPMPVAGFFTGFEIGPLGDEASVLQYSGVLATIAEKP